MAKNLIPNVNYFLMGLGLGSAVGILFAPKSGDETREYIARKAREGNELARKKAQELRDRAEDTVERGKDMISQARGQITNAIDAGLETYKREKSRAQVS